MNRYHLHALALCAFFVAFGCSRSGYNPYGELRDVVHSIGANSSVFLHSSADGTDMVLFGSHDPLAVVEADAPQPFIAGKVLTDSSANLFYGTYELDATGHGTFHIYSAFTFVYQPELNLIERDGALRADFRIPYDYPITVARTTNGLHVRLDYESAPIAFDYTNIDDVMAAIDTSGSTAHHDAYQLYNFSLVFSQLRVDSFGSFGMTQYIAAPGHFAGLVAGFFTVEVNSLLHPTTTIDYHSFEDMAGIWIDGPLVTKVDTGGNGPMAGVVTYEFRRGGNPLDVVLSGTIDYRALGVRNGIAHSGNYMVTIDGVQGEQPVPYTVASNITLTNILPITPQSTMAPLQRDPMSP